MLLSIVGPPLQPACHRCAEIDKVWTVNKFNYAYYDESVFVPKISSLFSLYFHIPIQFSKYSLFILVQHINFLHVYLATSDLSRTRLTTKHWIALNVTNRWVIYNSLAVIFIKSFLRFRLNNIVVTEQWHTWIGNIT